MAWEQQLRYHAGIGMSDRAGYLGFVDCLSKSLQMYQFQGFLQQCLNVTTSMIIGPEATPGYWCFSTLIRELCLLCTNESLFITFRDLWTAKSLESVCRYPSVCATLAILSRSLPKLITVLAGSLRSECCCSLLKLFLVQLRFISAPLFLCAADW